MFCVPVEILTQQVSNTSLERWSYTSLLDMETEVQLWIVRKYRKAIVLFQPEKQVTLQMFEEYFTGPRSPLAGIKDSVTKPHRKTVKSSSDKHIQSFWRSILILPSHLGMGFPRSRFASDFLNNFFYTTVLFPKRIACPGSINPMIFCDECKLWYFLSHNCFHPPFVLCYLSPRSVRVRNTRQLAKL
jgi:hypothetical protein